MKLILEFSNETNELHSVNITEAPYPLQEFALEEQRSFIIYHLSMAISETVVSDMQKKVFGAEERAH